MLFRRLLGAAALCDKLLVLPSVHDFYLSNLYPMDQLYDPLEGIIFSPYQWHDGWAVVWGVHYGEVVLALLLMADKGNGALLSAIMWFVRAWNWRRLPMGMTAGDPLLTMAMLASALLPGNAVVCGEPAVVMLRLQMCLVYLVSVLHKLLAQPFPGEERLDWLGGTAISQIFSCRKGITAAGEWVADSPLLCRLLTWGTLVIQGSSCIALMGPGRIRVAALTAVTLMHIGMAVTMRLFNFMPIVFAALTIFVPTTAAKAGRRQRWGLGGVRRAAAVAITGVMLLLTLRDTLKDFQSGWPAGRVRIGDAWLDMVADTLQIRTGWGMYSGSYRCDYYAVPAQLRDQYGGGWVDLYRVRNVHGEVPHWEVNVSRPSSQISSMLWEGNLAIVASHSGIQDGPCRYMTSFYCREYPMMQRVTLLDFKSPLESTGETVCSHECPPSQ